MTVVYVVSYWFNILYDERERSTTRWCHCLFAHNYVSLYHSFDSRLKENPIKSKHNRISQAKAKMHGYDFIMLMFMHIKRVDTDI